MHESPHAFPFEQCLQQVSEIKIVSGIARTAGIVNVNCERGSEAGDTETELKATADDVVSVSTIPSKHLRARRMRFSELRPSSAYADLFLVVIVALAGEGGSRELRRARTLR
jgi:hypothetical protein